MPNNAAHEVTDAPPDPPRRRRGDAAAGGGRDRRIQRRRGRRHPAPPGHRLPRVPRATTTGTPTSAGCRSTPAAPPWLSHMSPTRRLHPDFGPSYGEQPVPYGIPVTVVGGEHPKVAGALRLRRRERPGALPARRRHQDRGRPVGRRRPARDRGRQEHLPAVRDVRRPTSAAAGGPRAPARRGRCTSNKLRPQGWTSADAAGLPILPGLLRYAEVERAATSTTPSGSPPTSPTGGTCGRPGTTPDRSATRRTRRWVRGSGSRRRSRSRRYRADTRVVLRAMKRYGLVLADNGSPWYFQGTADDRWPQRAARPAQDDPRVGVRGRRHRAAADPLRQRRRPAPTPADHCTPSGK